MASIARRPDGQWRARYRDSAGREHSRHFPRKIDAQRWLNETTAAVVTGRYVDPKAGLITVEAFAGQWRATLVHRPGYLRIIDNALKNYILPTLGARPLSSLRHCVARTFKASCLRWPWTARLTRCTTSTGCSHRSWVPPSMTCSCRRRRVPA